MEAIRSQVKASRKITESQGSRIGLFRSYDEGSPMSPDEMRRRGQLNTSFTAAKSQEHEIVRS